MKQASAIVSEVTPTQLPLPLPEPANGESTAAADSPASMTGQAQAAPSDAPPTPRATEGQSDAATRSPFAGHIPADRPASDGQTGVRLTISTIHSVIQLSTWPTGVDAWLAALANAIAAPLPQKTGDTQAASLGLAMRTGPEELMIVSDDAAQPASRETVAALRQHVTADVGSVLDLSHARGRIRIEGERCVDALSKLFALDFRKDAFPVGKLKLSSHHHVPCAMHRIGSTGFDVYVFTTYAREMLEAIADAALEFGMVLGSP